MRLLLKKMWYIVVKWSYTELVHCAKLACKRNYIWSIHSTKCRLNHCLGWYNWVLMNLDHDRQWFKTLISPLHESPVVYFVCRSELRKHRPSLLQVQGCQWKHVVGSWPNVAFVVIVSEWSYVCMFWYWICTIGYIWWWHYSCFNGSMLYISGISTVAASSQRAGVMWICTLVCSSAYVYNRCLAWYNVLLIPSPHFHPFPFYQNSPTPFPGRRS